MFRTPLLLISLCFAGFTFGQAEPTAQIATEVKNGKALSDLVYLSDMIGPRLTGSLNLAKAQKWAMGKMKEYGAENVHLESYSFPSRWERGHNDYLHMLTQGKRQMTVHAMPWNPGTKGLITADAALLDGPVDELLKNTDRFKGKIVVLGNIRPPKDGGDANQLQIRLHQLIGKKARAYLLSMEHGDGKFTMYGSPDDAYFTEYFGGWPRLPFGFLIAEDRAMLSRLLKNRQKVTLHLRLGGRITKSPVVEHNVVGEIRGSEKPNEIVLIGGHLDSWDLGTGTADNGTGSVATLESLRVLKKLGVRPKRTIRFVLFSGEEQGSYGAKAYVKRHKAELGNYQAVLIHDLGGGKPTGFTVQGYGQWVPFLKNAMAPLAGIGVTGIPIERHWDSDQDPFVMLGVPSFFLDQDTEEYFRSTHHSQTDTINHVDPAEYLLSVQAFATVAWNFASMEQRVPHVPVGRMVGPDKDIP